MIGSGIFIVSADIARQVKSASLLLLVWVFTALVHGGGGLELRAPGHGLPQGGGQYVYLREAWATSAGSSTAGRPCSSSRRARSLRSASRSPSTSASSYTPSLQSTSGSR